MNLNHLRFVLEVERENSFTAAAEKCNVTQPTLSNGISQLEAELGGRLFERTTRTVCLTHFGRQMIPPIQALLAARRDLVEAAHGYFNPEHALLAIGFSPLIDMRLLSALADPFKDDHTHVSMRFKECFVEGLIPRLIDGQISVAARAKPLRDDEGRGDIVSVPFYKEPVFVVLREGAHVDDIRADSVTVDELAAETFSVTPNVCGHADATRVWFERRGKRLREYPGQAVSYQVMQDWANLGLASAILPWSKINRDNRPHAIALFLEEHVPVRLEFELISSKRAQDTAPVRAFTEHCRRTAGPLVSGMHLADEHFTVE